MIQFDQSPNLTVIILTYNEEQNIKLCLDSLRQLNAHIFVVDSYSTDQTLSILQDWQISYVQHPFDNYAQQRNWAQANCPFNTEWVLHLDAGERATPELIFWLQSKFDPDENLDGYMFSRRTYFLGQWIRWGGHYPNYHLRLYRKSKGHCEAKAYDQHFVVDGQTKKLPAGIDMIDEVTDSIHNFTLTHNKWALFEALESVATVMEKGEVTPKLLGTPIQRRRWLKSNVFQKTPLFVRSMAYFLYRYFIRLGFLDGTKGLVFHFLQGFWFRFLIDANIFEVQNRIAKEKNKPLEELIKQYYGSVFLKGGNKQRNIKHVD